MESKKRKADIDLEQFRPARTRRASVVERTMALPVQEEGKSSVSFDPNPFVPFERKWDAEYMPHQKIEQGFFADQIETDIVNGLINGDRNLLQSARELNDLMDKYEVLRMFLPVNSEYRDPAWWYNWAQALKTPMRNPRKTLGSTLLPADYVRICKGRSRLVGDDYVCT